MKPLNQCHGRCYCPSLCSRRPCRGTIYIYMTNAISEFDQAAYLKIRENVSAFIAKQADLHDSESITLLDIAPQVHAGAKQFFLKSQVDTADIDPLSGADYIIDITRNNAATIPDEMFDLVVCTEVLEHTVQPFAAVDEIFRMLKKGGLLLMTTPFNFRIHGPLPDCWRFSEHGIRALLTKFDSVQITPLEDEDRFLMPIHYTTIAKK